MADAPKSGEPAAESPSAQPPDAGPPAGAGGASGASAPPQSAEAAAESSAGPPAEPSSAAAASKPAPVEPKPSAAKPAVLEKPVAAKPKPAAAKPRPKPKPKAPPEAPKGPVDPPPPEDLEKPAFLIALEAALPDRIQQISYWVGDWTVIVAPEALLEVGAFLKDSDEGSFDYCADLTATDWPPREKRFDVVYCLYSTRRRQRVRIKVQAAGGEAVPSVTGLWPAANWLEREVWDMFGVNVTGHPDLRRILMPPAWQGHPQRKDYPLEGPGEFLLESPMEWLRLRNARDEAEIE
jgi:NADH-quinone oxidoreductase subunit C